MTIDNNHFVISLYTYCGFEKLFKLLVAYFSFRVILYEILYNLLSIVYSSFQFPVCFLLQQGSVIYWFLLSGISDEFPKFHSWYLIFISGFTCIFLSFNFFFWFLRNVIIKMNLLCLFLWYFVPTYRVFLKFGSNWVLRFYFLKLSKKSFETES